MSYSYENHSTPFVQKFVHCPKYAPASRYEPYAPSPYMLSKLFAFQYTLEPPSQMRFKIRINKKVP